MPSAASVFVKHKGGQDHFQLYNLHRTQVYVALLIESTYGLSSDNVLQIFFCQSCTISYKDITIQL